MKTILDLIEEGLPELEAASNVRCAERMQQIYKKHPELKEIDDEKLSVTGNRYIAVIDKDERLVARLDLETEKLTKKREAYIKQNKIDPEFDQPKPQCFLCKDTGFVEQMGVKVVCACKHRELAMCYELSGLSGYDAYDPLHYKPDYISGKDKLKRREKAMEELLGIACSKYKGNTPLFVYTDSSGIGKTYISICACKTAVNFGRSIHYAKFEELPEYKEDTLESIKHADFVVIDDFDPYITTLLNRGTILNAILEVRNAANLPTVLVTQSTLTEVVSKSDMRLSGKLRLAQTIPERRKDL